MTIASAFNDITVAKGGTPNKSGTIAGAIDALNDTLAGSDQPASVTIEGAIKRLGENIGGGGGGSTIGGSYAGVRTLDISWTGDKYAAVIAADSDLSHCIAATVGPVDKISAYPGVYVGFAGDMSNYGFFYENTDGDEKEIPTETFTDDNGTFTVFQVPSGVVEMWCFVA